jgi:SAM-dependent methyltransferase
MSIVSRSSIDSASSDTALSLRTRLQCPVCERALDTVPGDEPGECSQCGFTISLADGIYRALAPDRREYFSRFVSEYQAVREKEGRGSASAEYYLALPFRDLSGHNSWQWSIRARTFSHLLKRILPRIEAEQPEGADILDIGAGNGWFSYRLALRGHRPVAVDLVDNDADGLGAAHHYASRLKNLFPRFQAEMDRLPFAPCQFDAVVLNASLHYSTNYQTTLREAVRCLRCPGYLLVTDSPFYRRKHSGEQMVREKRAAFLRRFGFASDSVESEEFVTRERLSELSQQLGLRWQIEKPWYGIGWAFRPVKAQLLGKREPAKFYMLWARVER